MFFQVLVWGVGYFIQPSACQIIKHANKCFDKTLMKIAMKWSKLFQIISRQEDYDLLLLQIIMMCVVVEMKNLSATAVETLQFIQEEAYSIPGWKDIVKKENNNTHQNNYIPVEISKWQTIQYSITDAVFKRKFCMLKFSQVVWRNEKQCGQQRILINHCCQNTVCGEILLAIGLHMLMGEATWTWLVLH